MESTKFLKPSFTNRRVTRQKEDLTALIDWCQITVKEEELFTIIEDILKIPLNFMELHYKGSGIAGHELVAGFDNIKVLKPTGKAQYEGFQILMSGSGCRAYENFLRINDETWFDFLERACTYKVNFPRLDLAIDDRKPYLDISELIQLTNEGLISSQLRAITEYNSKELNEDGMRHKGNTLYLGSSKSDFRIVFYEKGYEQEEKFRTKPDPNWNRYELRFRKEWAVKAVQGLVEHRDVARVAMQILNEKVRFLQRPENSAATRKRLYPTYLPWEEFMRDIEKVRLTIEPQKKSLERVWNWLNTYVSPSLKLFAELGEIEDIDYIHMLVENGRMKQVQKKMYDDYMKSLRLVEEDRRIFGREGTWHQTEQECIDGQ